MKRHHYQTRSKSKLQNEPNQADGCSSRTPTKQRTDEVDPNALSKCSRFPKQEMRFLHLPPEIISLILVTLPVKTLSILKCVCVYFSRMISSPDFIGAHLKLSCEDASMSGYRVILRPLNAAASSGLKQISIPSLWRESFIHSINLDYPKKGLVKQVLLAGSCNGLVFITVNNHHMFIWNPTIRKHKKLPDIRKLESLKKHKWYFRFGFAFDVSNDDYKVMALTELNYTEYASKTNHAVCVYSLKRSSWMRIPDFTGNKLIERYGKLASGQLHWSTVCLDIVSFDVEREVFGTLEPPNYAERCVTMALSMLGGSICVSYNYGRHVDVWVMKEYGKKESWNKIITLPDFIISAYPCSFLPNGEVLMYDYSLWIYNLRRNSRRSLEIPHYYDPLVYVESLVPPCCNRHERQNLREGRRKVQ